MCDEILIDGLTRSGNNITTPCCNDVFNFIPFVQCLFKLNDIYNRSKATETTSIPHLFFYTIQCSKDGVSYWDPLNLITRQQYLMFNMTDRSTKTTHLYSRTYCFTSQAVM